MAGNSFGELFRITTFGESHGAALGCTVDGMPGNLPVNLDDLKRELKRRAPGQHIVHTSRTEQDEPEILCGVFEGKTLGTPITVIVRNTNQKSEDYKDLKVGYRPGHADKTTMDKFGIRDHRGGGRASGRETVARVIGGYFAGLIMKDVSAYAYIEQVGQFKLSQTPAHGADRGEINIPEKRMSDDVIAFLKDCKASGESAGGIVALSLKGVAAGLGEPVFDKMKADLAKAMLSLPACTGFEIGAGFSMANMKGSDLSADKKNFGGMEGGITNGDDITLRVVFKAPSTLGENAKNGRHDPCILPRVIPVVEAMAKIVIADHYLRQTAYSPFLP
jgi:chorismate synthase